ncbi:M20/M25/M40 family metallo-hydrolase [Kitasatospora sp. NPDC056184]|uniref:M20/M25/M40 family metallo-hydrolase n=1 Tax=Kitasatospora sp. NPDC056184 TaxID=3345738 RepID=UPI0035E27D7D
MSPRTVRPSTATADPTTAVAPTAIAAATTQGTIGTITGTGTTPACAAPTVNTPTGVSTTATVTTATVTTATVTASAVTTADPTRTDPTRTDPARTADAAPGAAVPGTTRTGTARTALAPATPAPAAAPPVAAAPHAPAVPDSEGQPGPTAALPGLPQALTTRARTLAGAVRRRCADLARIESPSGDAPRLDALAEELAAGFRATGATVQREPGPAGDHLVLQWDGRDESLPHLLVVGHHDTVWPAGILTDWPVTEQDGTLSGPGVVDMKGGLAILEGAFALLADLGQRPHRTVRLVVVSDEEVGSPDGRRLVERQLRGAGAVLGLEPPHPDGRLKTARRGSTRVRLTVTGREAHAGNDAAEGVSAVDELVDQLVAVRGLVSLPGTELNAGRISGGSRANVVAGRAEAELGLRFATTEAQRRTLDNLARLTALRPGARVRTEVLSSRPAWPERSGNPLLRHVRSLAAVLGQQLDGGPAGGAGDTNLPGSRGLPTLDGFGAVGGGAHARHEHIRIDQLAPRIALLAALLAVPLPRLRDRSEG